MADSLVKFDNNEKSATSAIWRNIREMLDGEFPEAAIISEWSCPPLSIKAGFHVDFLLDHGTSGYRSLVRHYEDGGKDNSYFKKEGNGSITRFLDQYMPWYEATKNDGFISMISGNHDTPRVSHGLSPRELSLFYALLFTMPGVPFLYYGDEIGMRYLYSLPTKEGGYGRTGSRSPMQWNPGTNAGFSSASPEKLYLPVDAEPGAPDVESQEKDPLSLLNTVKGLLRLRNGNEELGSKPNLQILHAGSQDDRSFFYKRGAFIIGINPGTDAVKVSVSAPKTSELVYSIGGCGIENGIFKLEPQSFGVWKF
jgi:maltose alpha-D-glucosyltransferase/alpha-amylase